MIGKTSTFFAYRAQALRLYRDLMSFKKTEEFKTMGFGAGFHRGNDWLLEVESLRGKLTRSKCSVLLKVIPGILIQMGLEYIRTGGEENEFTRYNRDEIESELLN